MFIFIVIVFLILLIIYYVNRNKCSKCGEYFTAKLIDQEIRGFIDEAEGHARKILKKYIKHLHSLAKALLEYETLSGDEVNELIKKGKIKSNKHDDIDSNNKKTSIPLGKKDVKRKRNIGLDPKPAAS